ncbi:glutamate 5-kinase [Acetobacter ghanensis]|uniref:Glutamate 5-kinase n=1 Tax=Acetobacter ghanensis TaxID=431306 RepID=A0A0U5BLZ0_9PROT|nr:glutamate 5-kinase [Acetobacter ghanensis]
MTTDIPCPSLLRAKRLVIKIGSALVVDPQKAAPRQEWLASVAADIATLRKQGVAVSVVSSGAIALARHTLGLTGGPLRLAEKQAAAAVGQISLAQAWSHALSAHGLTAAQLLLTPEDTEDRKRYLNARATLNTLLELGCVPVINENDTIATAEIRFGDNDRLAARVAQMTDADQLVLLSDIDGLYTADPRTNPNAQHLPVIECLTPEIEAMGGEPPTGLLLWRYAYQTAGRQYCHPLRVCHGHCHWQNHAPAPSSDGWRTLLVVFAANQRSYRPQTMDCRQPEPHG